MFLVCIFLRKSFKKRLSKKLLIVLVYAVPFFGLNKQYDVPSGAIYNLYVTKRHDLN